MISNQAKAFMTQKMTHLCHFEMNRNEGMFRFFKSIDKLNVAPFANLTFFIYYFLISKILEAYQCFPDLAQVTY